MRPPIDDRLLGSEQLDPIAKSLDQFATSPSARARKRARRASRKIMAASSSDMTLFGQQLLNLLIPSRIQGDLRKGGLFLEIGMDQALLDYPWELMHDGHDFLCLKHQIGRFVNVTAEDMTKVQLPKDWVGVKLDRLSVLIISVPNPKPRYLGDSFDPLPGAKAETDAIVKTLDRLRKQNVRVVYELKKDNEATYNEVSKVLMNGNYQIVHFSGHARYDERDPSQSGLALYDRDMSAGEVVGYFSKNPPVLCFMNACETGRTGTPGSPTARTRKVHHDIFGLAQAFLRTGAYLIGSRWTLGDKAAEAFAKQFYLSLLGREKSIGDAITGARKACKEASREDQFSWASYLFYGDPRLYFRRAHTHDSRIR